MDVNTAALQLMEKKREVGYTAYNAFGHYRDRYYPIIQFFEAHGEKEWNDALAEEYRNHLMHRVDINEIGTPRYNQLLFGLNELEEFLRTGNLLWPFRKFKRDFTLSPYYEKVKKDFLKSKDFHPNTKGDIIWICDRYFSWLQHGYHQR